MKKRFFAILVAVLISISLLLSSCMETSKSAFEKAKSDTDAFLAECAEKTKEALTKDIPAFSLFKELSSKGKLTANVEIDGLNVTANAFVDGKNAAFTFDVPVPQAQGIVISAGAYCKDGVLTLDLSKIFGEGLCASVKTENILDYVKALMHDTGDDNSAVINKLFDAFESLDLEKLKKDFTDFANELTDVLGFEAKEEEATVNGETKKFVVITAGLNNEKLYTVIEKAFAKFYTTGLNDFFKSLTNEISFRIGESGTLSEGLEEITAQTVIDAIKESGAEINVEYNLTVDPDTYLPVKSTVTANVKITEDGETENVTISYVIEYPKNMSLLGKYTETMEINVDGEVTSTNTVYEAEEKDGIIQGKLELKGSLFLSSVAQSINFTYNKENGDFTVKLNAFDETSINGKFTYDSDKFTLTVGSVSANGKSQTVGLTISGEKNAEFPEVPVGTEIKNSDDFMEFIQTIAAAFGGMPGEPNIEPAVDFD